MNIENNRFERIRQVIAEKLTIKEPSNTLVPTFEWITCMVFQFSGQADDFFTLLSASSSLC